ncbi:hypothetical protein VNO77_23335 [Canavalia gladiata]|uniref:Uncharacterized protein n=1 Tax=Canavalia gladiata TaxID=3824 RepID=A0AAN9L494_CANGL
MLVMESLIGLLHLGYGRTTCLCEFLDKTTVILKLIQDDNDTRSKSFKGLVLCLTLMPYFSLALMEIDVA